MLVGIDFRPADRLLYALARSGSLYRIDASTGVATALGPVAADVADTSAPYAGLQGASFGIDFNPVVDRSRVLSDAGQNLRINVDTGKVITDTPLQPATPSVSAAAYGNAFAAACRTRLYGVDTATGQLVLVDPPNDGKLTPIGALGISGAPTGSAAFDVYTSADGIDRASLLLEVDSTPMLFDVNLGTGAATAPRRIELEPGESVIGFGAAPPLSAPTQAPGELLGMTESQRIVSFNRAAPAKLCTSAAVNGLAPNERVLGLDVRPSDGVLYALGSAGDIYTLDVASGVATRRALLMADPNDTTDPGRPRNGRRVPDGSGQPELRRHHQHRPARSGRDLDRRFRHRWHDGEPGQRAARPQPSGRHELEPARRRPRDGCRRGARRIGQPDDRRRRAHQRVDARSESGADGVRRHQRRATAHLLAAHARAHRAGSQHHPSV